MTALPFLPTFPRTEVILSRLFRTPLLRSPLSFFSRPALLALVTCRALRVPPINWSPSSTVHWLATSRVPLFRSPTTLTMPTTRPTLSTLGAPLLLLLLLLELSPFLALQFSTFLLDLSLLLPLPLLSLALLFLQLDLLLLSPWRQPHPHQVLLPLLLDLLPPDSSATASSSAAAANSGASSTAASSAAGNYTTITSF